MWPRPLNLASGVMWDMGVRLVVLSYPRLTPKIEKVTRESFPGIDIRVLDAIFQDLVQVARRLQSEKSVDVFISGGANASILRQVVDLPVVEFQVSGIDLLAAVAQAAAYGRVVPIFTYQKPVGELLGILPLLNVTVHPAAYREVQDLARQLEEFKNLGCRAVVGSSLVCDYAEQAGLKGILIYSTAAISNAIQTAIDLANARQREAERAERLKAILDFTYSGILATDNEGRITVFNPAAEKILGIKASEAVGQPVGELISNTGLPQVLSSGKTDLNAIMDHHGAPILTNRVPIIVAGKVRGAVATFHDAASVQKAEHKLRRNLSDRGLTAQHTFADVFGQSEAIKKVVAKAKRFAGVDSSVLLLGETGTGKELFAQGIHNASRRRNGPFVAVNCAALPESLLESELFGYDDGAFTGARKGGRMGLFELAHGGTVFLDEIGEVPLAIQARLLRVLEQRQIMRVGGNKVIPVDIRVVAATNRNLREEVQAGRFREDLYYRLDVLRLDIPPLRERQEDILILIEKILDRLAPRLSSRLKPHFPILHPLLARYNWPGNIRELENLLERFALTAPESEPQGLVAAFTAEIGQLSGQLWSPPEKPQGVRPSYPARRLPAEKISEAIAACRGNRSEAARQLGISRTTLYRRLRCAQ